MRPPYPKILLDGGSCEEQRALPDQSHLYRRYGYRVAKPGVVTTMNDEQGSHSLQSGRPVDDLQPCFSSVALFGWYARKHFETVARYSGLPLGVSFGSRSSSKPTPIS